MVRRVLSSVLVVVMVGQLVPMSVYAVDAAAPQFGYASPTSTTVPKKRVGEDTIEPMAEGITTNIEDRVSSALNAGAAQACGLARTAYEVKLMYDSYRWLPILDVISYFNLFRNECWRNTIWAIDDYRDALAKQQADLWYQQCTVENADPSDLPRPDGGQGTPSLSGGGLSNLMVSQELQDRIDQLAVTREFFGDQKFLLSSGDVDFGVLSPKAKDSFEVDLMGTEVVRGSTLMNWLIPTTGSAWRAVFSNYWGAAKTIPSENMVIPLVEFLGQLSDDSVALVMSFGYFTELVYKNYEEWKKDHDGVGFENYVKGNHDAIQKSIQDAVKIIRASLKSADLEKARVDAAKAKESAANDAKKDESKKTLKSARAAKTYYESQQNKLINLFEHRAQVASEQAAKEMNALQELLKSGKKADFDEVKEVKKSMFQFRATVSFFQFMAVQIGKCGSTLSVSQLGGKIEEIVEAITGLSKGGSLGSSQTVTQRIEAARVRSLQKMCDRLETMYRETGRNLSVLPRFDIPAGGELYCRQSVPCPKGKSAAECFGEGLMKSIEESRDPEKDAIVQRLEEGALRDLGTALSERRILDLLSVRQAAYLQLRQKYAVKYAQVEAANGAVSKVIEDINALLWNKANDGAFRAVGGPVNNPNNQVGRLRHIYEELFKFSDEVGGYCPMDGRPGG